MAISIGKPNIRLDEILSKVSELDIIHHYFGVTNVPCIISSPLRPDNHPSFGFYSLDGKKIHWTDLATKDGGGVFDLLGKYWGESYNDVLAHVWEDLPKITSTDGCSVLQEKRIVSNKAYNSNIDLQCRVREWKKHDLEYWESYGISLKWLEYADIYPISHKIVIKEGSRFVFPADKYAYAYVEYKEGKVTLKIYQPFNKRGYKWSNRHDRSVISLWTKVPEYGDRICVCSSMKDALCLWANTGIPALAIQGEGYGMSDTAINELKRRYKNIYVLLDNDEAGLKDGEKLSASTGFINIVLPKFNGGKDVSDLYKYLGDKERFRRIMLDLFENKN